MLRPLIIVCFVCLSWLPAQAAERGALFRLSAHGHTMFLFGTMHVGLPAFYPLEPQLAAAVESASVLALELDPQPSFAKVAAALNRYGKLAPDAAGYAELGPRKLTRIDEMARAAGIDPATARTYKPVLLATLLSLAEYEKQGYRASLSTDRELARMARARGVHIVELESLEGQLAMLDSLPVPSQWRFLEECLNSISSGAQANEVRTVVGAWGSADQAGLEAMAQRMYSDNSVGGTFTREVLLDGRNGGLADKIDKLLEDKDKAVSAIGVLHLLGPRSVPELLRARGIAVERVY